MGLPAEPRMDCLPKRFPVGSVYVVEGHGGQYGHLRVSTRYVIMPGGRRVDIPARTRASASPRQVPSRAASQLPEAQSKGRQAVKKSASAAKKYALVGGTMGRQSR